MRRKIMSKSRSRKNFRKNSGIHKANTARPRNMRGGIRF